MIGQAQQWIAEAVAAGADASAADVMQIARQHLAQAQTDAQNKKPELAAIQARLAVADAMYARAAANRVKAEQARTSEQQQLRALAQQQGNN
jgi:Arc/MetJ-type ribon-helix-helix transcriptional regulator